MKNKKTFYLIVIAVAIIAAAAIMYRRKKKKEETLLLIEQETEGTAVSLPATEQAGPMFGGVDQARKLGIGSRGLEVRALQEAINQRGANPPVEVDGIFGPKTLTALQQTYGVSEVSLSEVYAVVNP